MRGSRLKLTAFAAAALLAPSIASALPTGMFDVARPYAPGEVPDGCSCHTETLPKNTTTRLFVVWTSPDGLISFDPPAAYEPGSAYDISIWVLGIAVPVPVAAGFNFEPDKGELAAADDSAEVLRETECDLMKRYEGCTSSATCTLYTPTCPAYGYDQRSDPGCRRCTANDPTESCRLCDNVATVRVQATHTAPKSTFMWDFTWTAPPPGSGEVTFYLAGNVVNGLLAASGDVWSVLLAGDPLFPWIRIPEGSAGD